MKPLTLLSFVMLLSLGTVAQKDPRLLGTCSVKDFEREPFAAWYKPGYERYTPSEAIINEIKKVEPEKFTLKIVFGSWCGDTRRELPKMMKVLHAAGFPEKNIVLTGVYDSLEVYKQGPNREEKGLHIYRVPTFIVYQKDKEIGRIVEYPVESLERDLQKIISRQPYTHNYAGYVHIKKWLAQGLLQDANINPRGLAGQLRNIIGRETELNACGYVLLMRGDVKEAITIFRINTALFPQSPNCFDSLGEAYLMAGLKNESKASYERVLELDPQHANARAQLEKLK